jgi:hypothetical protein
MWARRQAQKAEAARLVLLQNQPSRRNCRKNRYRPRPRNLCKN